MDSTAVTLEFAGTSTENYVVAMEEADYFRFEHMTVRNTSSSYGIVFYFNAGNDWNEINNCVIENTSGGSISTNVALIYSPGGSLDNYNKFQNNVFRNGSYGMDWYGIDNSDNELETVLVGNDFLDQYYRGAYLYYQVNTLFSHNTITS